jgi:plasmid stabilization system protein ParE
MVFRVEITPRAQRDLDGIYAKAAREAPYAGPLWFARFEESILSLAEFPERCPVEPRLSTSGRPVRKHLFGRRRHVYRVYFTIIADAVKVLHVRHGARKAPTSL